MTSYSQLCGEEMTEVNGPYSLIDVH